MFAYWCCAQPHHGKTGTVVHRYVVLASLRAMRQHDARRGGINGRENESPRFGTDLPIQFAQASDLMNKILKCAKLADLLVEQPTKFELVVKLKTAKALGLAVRQPILQVADGVIE